jgi:hypothetical protein
LSYQLVIPFGSIYKALAKSIQPSHPPPSEWERVASLKYAYGQIVELKVQLDMMGRPNTIKMQIASWSKEMQDISDKMADFSWITYEVKG